MAKGRTDVTISLPMIRFLDRQDRYITLTERERTALEQLLVTTLARVRNSEVIDALQIRILVPRVGPPSSQFAGIVDAEW
jgi:FAD/FMN-containing dehydrogenase